MSKLRTTLVSIMIAAVVSLGLTGCPSKEEPPPSVEQSAAEIEAQIADQNTPTDEKPAADHPAGEHPTGEHPE
ncbi:MAG: hypothetical protein HQ515_26285 [Phycisphaeraceae bacterium]|nr:hypothetical protein [Phycisphaeraceae bacterium]